eukprot:gnl/TRDRNA2_/TRDRNA2_175867_c0_seq1.p1 gnl/TRDRNA2_/TRDRNA2_175867_c0~~gnl/TRDRNA2_/TRDRNA2_175867_c0_seq1.p1  ORF type:complete len:715 (-),score=248.94 gnl/TRDRNA2_/TRDRNA2_175867_c0_seq1:100-2244(-)
MQLKYFTLLALPLLASGSRSAVTTGSPMEKVVELLTDLKGRIITDGELEQKAYDKYGCWCETTSARKADAIVQAKADLRALGQSILKLKGRVATRNAEIAELKDDISKNQAAQDQATSVRNKENAAYMATTSEMKQAIASLQDAVKVLGDATGKVTLLQSTAGARERAAQGVTRALQALPSTANLKQDQIALLSEFAASGASSKYAPQSASIQGILTDMYTTFSANVEQETRTEAQKNRAFEDFMATKQQEMLDAQATQAKKEEELAEAERDLAETTATYDETEAQMNADIKFFDVTKKACQDKSGEWDVRVEMRKQELEGIKEALKLLTSDEARELFASAIKPGMETSFLQVSRSSNMTPQQSAYAVLKKHASSAHSLRLASLAALVQTSKTGHFEEVIKSIEDLKGTLADEGKSDQEKRDTCKEEYQKIASKIADLTWKIKNNEAKIDKLEKAIELRKVEKAKTILEIQNVEKEIKEMEDQRKAENEAFLNAKAEDEAAIELLGKTKDVLSKFYKENKIEMGKLQGAALIQKPEFEVSEDQAPDATFSDKGGRKNESKGIISIISMIMEDLQDEVKNGKKNEAQAQLDFEAELETAQNLKSELIAKKEELSDIIAKRNVEKTEENQDKTKNEGDLKDEEDYRAEIKPDCDFMLKYFEARFNARQQEMNGLTSAEEFLAGASASHDLQAPALIATEKFDDDALPRAGFLHLSK